MEVKASSNFSVPFVLFLVFLTLKLTEVIDWSWVWVTSPLWIWVSATLLILGLMLIGGGVVLWKKRQ